MRRTLLCSMAGTICIVAGLVLFSATQRAMPQPAGNPGNPVGGGAPPDAAVPDLDTTVVFSVQRLENEHTVLCVAYSLDSAEVLELDARGNVVWRFGNGLGWTHSAQYLPASDTFLLADTRHNRVIEVDRAGQIVWSCNAPGLAYPNDAERLSNGHTLITVRDADLVVEVDADSRVVWSHRGIHGPHNADRLGNSHTLIANSRANRVQEVAADGSLVWQCGNGLAWPRDADRLANGHTLIADTGHSRVVEVDARGEVVWEYADAPMIYDADRLPNGHTLMSINPRSGGRVVEAVAAGRIVWEWRAPANPAERWGMAYAPALRPVGLRASLLDEVRGALDAGVDPAVVDATLRMHAASPADALRAVRCLPEGSCTLNGTCNPAVATIVCPDALRTTRPDRAGQFTLAGLAVGRPVWVVVVPDQLDRPLAELLITPRADAEPLVVNLESGPIAPFRRQHLVVVVGLTRTGEPVPLRVDLADSPVPLRVHTIPAITAAFGNDANGRHAAATSLANLTSRGQPLQPRLAPMVPGHTVQSAGLVISLANLREPSVLTFHCKLPTPTQPSADAACWTNHPQWSTTLTRIDDDTLEVTVRVE